MKLEEVIELKRYLQGKPISADAKREYDRRMREAEQVVSSAVPSVKGMIWNKGKINPNASVDDVTAALDLLSKFGQANLDDLGSPSDPNRLSGTPMNSMFISQEDSKLDEHTPGNNQNQGTEGSSVPTKITSSGKPSASKNPGKQPENANIDDRMRRLTKLIENVKK